MLNFLLDLDLIINLFFIFSKKLSVKDALIMTAITAILYYLYVMYKNKNGSSES
jgi:Ca2+/Na+ antiporter